MRKTYFQKGIAANCFKKKQRLLAAILFIVCFPISIYSQYTIQWPNKCDLRSIHFKNPNQTQGFIASVSLIALFTYGTHDRDGFRLGIGFNLAYRINDWLLHSGVDTYKVKNESFGLGTTYLGGAFFNGNIGGSYVVNRYLQGDKQTSSMIGFRTRDFELRFEDDILALPFTGFKIQDRFRTAAIELRYKRILLGVNVYTTDIDGVTDFSFSNKKGVYRQGIQISSPIYVGYTDRGLLVRYGLNNHLGGFWGQNGWHRTLFNTPDYNKGTYQSHFLQIGTNQPHTLY